MPVGTAPPEFRRHSRIPYMLVRRNVTGLPGQAFNNYYKPITNNYPEVRSWVTSVLPKNRIGPPKKKGKKNG